MDLNMEILIVDDFSTMRKIVKNTLKQIGFTNILEADDGTTALEALKEKKVDLIISDWNMPKMTGLDLLKTIRGEESTKDIPFVMVTAEAQKQNVIKAVQAGASDYVVKPFTANTVKEKLAKVLDK
jgi:two-component system chemotaxis response regulator CheY